jgi:hypothetical protein
VRLDVPRGEMVGEELELERELSRRGLLIGAGVSVLGMAGLVRLVDAAAAAAEALGQSGKGPAPGDTAVRASIAAIADTVVPGPAGGADRHPGAIEAEAVAEAYDDFYGVSGAYPSIHVDIQAATPLVLGRPVAFDLELPYADRERVLLDRISSTAEGGQSPLFVAYAALAIVVWFAYYGTARSTKGVEYIGFPPRSDGYWPQHSYRLSFRGMTRDGNPS